MYVQYFPSCIDNWNSEFNDLEENELKSIVDMSLKLLKAGKHVLQGDSC
ncbi:hypothetical protein Pint_31231 [Pistacia integerrima]|uniref:Uncharacterized protein n=1 Tax=Pistacia integerrima TaxID=434235 RepID=A0ACC0XM43_9ROSI|nr:hypothetical protein Pint_31231 [Pistacia integerrima]